MNRPKIAFIASLSHSGSTLLDLMLNAHPGIASVGELKQLDHYARLRGGRGRRRRCTCGAPSLDDCPFWAKVNATMKAHAGLGLGDIDVENYADPAKFNRDNAALFDAISAAVDSRYIVDSSKRVDRLELLMANQALAVFPIFLIRDPKGQICSSLRKNRKHQKHGKDPQGLVRRIGDYIWTNRRIYNLVKDRPHAVVLYETLARDPEKALRPLMQQLGLAFHPLQLHWAEQERHNISGNRMRFAVSSRVELDTNWREKLTLLQKFTIDVGTLPGRYPFVKFGLP
jgi:Sulfotransferase family